MEIFMHHILSLLLLPLYLYLIFLRKKRSGEPRNPPPGSGGWPIIGETLAYGVSGSREFVETRMKKHSRDVFRTSLMGVEMAVMCGAGGNKFVFANENKLVASWLPSPVKSMIFPDLGDGTFKEVLTASHDVQREAFGRAALRRCVRAIDTAAREVVGGWSPGSTVEIFPAVAKYSFEVGCRAFVDVADPERVERLWGFYSLMNEGLMCVPLDLPWMGFRRGLEGGRAVRGEVEEIIRERRKELMMEERERGRERGDVLSKMLLVMTDKDGKNLSDGMVAVIFVSLLFAGQFATTSAVTFVIGFLAQLPHIYDMVLKEQMEIAESKGPDEMLTWEDMEKMKYSWNVVRESLRLVPPVQGGFKEVIADFTYEGFTIPKGWKALWTVHSTHKNPNYFPEPEKFDPRRFEGSGPPPHTYVPFGGGPSMCPGRDFAKVLILVFVHNVVTRFKLEKAIPSEKIVFGGRAMPAHGLPVHLRPHHVQKQLISCIHARVVLLVIC